MAVRDTLDALSPITLINLSELSRWLFPRADIPAVALLACHRDQPAERLNLIQARWSEVGEKSHTIEIAPSDITTARTGLQSRSRPGSKDIWGRVAPQALLGREVTAIRGRIPRS